MDVCLKQLTKPLYGFLQRTILLGSLVLIVSCGDLPSTVCIHKWENGKITEKYTINALTEQKHGKFESFHENGKLKEVGNYSNNEKQGSWKSYDNNGKLVRKTNELKEDSWENDGFILSIISLISLIIIALLINEIINMNICQKIFNVPIQLLPTFFFNDLENMDKTNGNKNDLQNLLLNLFKEQNIIPFAADNQAEILKDYGQVTEEFKHFLEGLEDMVRRTGEAEYEIVTPNNMPLINEKIKLVGTQLNDLVTENSLLEKETIRLKAEIKTLSQKKDELEVNLTNSQTKIKVLEAKIKVLESNDVDGPIVSTNPFLCELHLSAGPRKSVRDPDLGEDVAGFRIQNDFVLFWLLDGTSDLNILRTPNEVEFFSSRLLAQLIAYHVKTAFDGHYELTDLHLLWDKAIQAAQIELQNKIQNMMAGLPDAFQQKIIRKSYNIGTVGIIGVLNTHGELKAIRIGDSSLHAVKKDGTFAPPTLSQNPREKDDTQFMSLFIDYDEYNQLTPFLKTTKTRRTQAEFKDIQKVVVHCDGIGGMTQRYMQSVLSKMPYSDFMKETSQTPQKTRDDKSFLFIGIE
jgi:hypothetical protein